MSQNARTGREDWTKAQKEYRPQSISRSPSTSQKNAQASPKITLVTLPEGVPAEQLLDSLPLLGPAVESMGGVLGCWLSPRQTRELFTAVSKGDETGVTARVCAQPNVLVSKPFGVQNRWAVRQACICVAWPSLFLFSTPTCSLPCVTSVWHTTAAFGQPGMLDLLQSLLLSNSKQLGGSSIFRFQRKSYIDMSPEALVQHAVNSRNNSGQSPLTFAALYDRPENVKKLVEMVSFNQAKVLV